jgi:hypothetical protein
MPNLSLKTKWGSIKYDVAKFCGMYKSMISLKEFGTLSKDVLEHSLELYKVKHLRGEMKLTTTTLI